MSRKRKRGSAEVNLGFQIAPMIDVVFVIMLYFMVMAGAVQVENAHNTKLPGGEIEGAPVDLPDEIAIKVEDDGQVYLNEEPVDSPEAKLLPELTINLNDLRKSSPPSSTDPKKPNLIVTIYSTEQAKYERIIDVLDSLSRAQIEDVTFQAGSLE